MKSKEKVDISENMQRCSWKVRRFKQMNKFAGYCAIEDTRQFRKTSLLYITACGAECQKIKKK